MLVTLGAALPGLPGDYPGQRLHLGRLPYAAQQNEPYIGVSACLAMGLLLANHDLTAAACESDWPTAVAQTIGTLLSGKPAACLDWVNYTGGSAIIQLGHCGVGICGLMAPGKCQGATCDAIALHPVIRLGGGVMGPVHIGQFEFGPKTGLCLTQDPDGKFKLLTFRGESTPKTARGLAYSAVDMAVPDCRKLSQLVLDGGFPHHLAVAMGDVSDEAKMLCQFLGVEWVSPDEGPPPPNPVPQRARATRKALPRWQPCTSRERVLTAIERRLPDRTPADYKAEPEVNQYMMQHLKVNSYEELLRTAGG